MRVTKMNVVATMAALLLVGASARAAIFTVSDTPDAPIPVGNPVGIASTINATGLPPEIVNVTMTLDISGGNNGDLYGYLSYDGVLVTLINRPGVSGSNPLGAMGSGFNVTLTDSAVVNVNNASETPGAVLTGTYNVNGSPGMPGNGSAAFQSAYSGLDPNGTWTLFLANESSGGDPSELVSWSLSIDTVPEPTNVALGIFGVCAVAGRLRAGWKKYRFASNSTDERK
jgi:hypothetical protein